MPSTTCPSPSVPHSTGPSLERVTPPSIDTDLASLIDALTRRGFIGGALATAALIGLSGCADDADKAARTTGKSGTRKVSTIHGEIDVPAQPTRVVTVSFVGTANLLDLGVTPVGGVTGSVEFLPAFTSKLDAMPIVADTAGQVDLEKVASLNPDLIVGSDWTNASQALLPYDDLRQIAPTALFEQGPSVGNWPNQAHGYADAVNRLADLTTLREKFLKEQSRIKSTYAGLLGKLRWEVINAAQSGLYRYSTAASHCKILAGAGFEFTEGAAALDKSFVQLSYEQLGDLKSASAIGLGRAVDQAWETSLTSQQLFQQLDAVQDDRVVHLKWFFPSSYGTAMALLSQVEPALITWAKAQ